MDNMDKIRENFINVNNDLCVLVEFFNESRACQVGYRSWFKKSLSDQDLDKIISNKEPIEIY